MKLPRDLSGRGFCSLLKRFGYEIVRQESSHIRLTSNYKSSPHHITVPDHDELKTGTLRALIRIVAQYLEVQPAELIRQLFDRS